MLLYLVNLIFVVSTVILVLRLYLVKKKWFAEKQKVRLEQQNRKKILDLSRNLLDIQIRMLRAEGKREPDFELEIVRYVADYALWCVLEGNCHAVGRERIHPWIRWKYPELFEIYGLPEEKRQIKEIKEGDKRHLDLSVERFEQEYGSLQEKYNAWRSDIEENLTSAGGCHLTDCAFRQAREAFAVYCGLEEIPFEVMLCYESDYEKKRLLMSEEGKVLENVKDVSRTKQEALEIMKTGGCPFVGEPCPDDLTVLNSDIDHICQKCVEWHFGEEANEENTDNGT